jgi:phosphotransferase system enzyme I (PtsI)
MIYTFLGVQRYSFFQLKIDDNFFCNFVALKILCLMKIFEGKIASEGLCCGTVFMLNVGNMQAKKVNLNNFNQLELYEDACKRLKNRILREIKNISGNLGEEYAEFLQIQLMFLDDSEFDGAIKNKISEGFSVVEAITVVANDLNTEFLAINDEYLSQRGRDVLNLAADLTNIILYDNDESAKKLPNNAIIVAEEITPNQILSFDTKKITALISVIGSEHAHSAILARMLNVPYLYGVSDDILKIKDGSPAVVDACNGKIYCDPTEEILEEVTKKMAVISEKRANLEKYRGKQSVTKTGKQVRLYANIATVEDAKTAVKNDAEGVGLLRTECFFMNHLSFPSEEEQRDFYSKVSLAINNKPLTIRTFDFGSDKKVPFLNLQKEENPALGYRGVRICLGDTNFFKTQLRAIYKVAMDVKNKTGFHSISLMFPMISSVWEVDECIKLCREVEKELKIDFKLPLGVMIETPAAVLIADKLAKKVDFFSVGTNDLSQYLLAVDRQGNTNVKKYFDPHHEAILQSLKMIGNAATGNNIEAGICGELAMDFDLTEKLIEYGFGEFSVNSNKILELRKRIINI